MVRLVLFDIDGTLIRTGGAGVKAFSIVFSEEFGAVEGFEKLKFAGRTDVSLVREFFDFHNIPATPENFTRFFARYVFWLEKILRESQASICPGVQEFISGLKALAQPPVLGLLTGNIRLGAELKLRHLGLWDEFATGAFADDHELREQIAAMARERGGQVVGRQLAPEETLVVGDTPLDIACGRAIGAKVLAVATGGSTLAEIQAHKPDWAMPDLTSVRPEEVMEIGKTEDSLPRT